MNFPNSNSGSSASPGSMSLPVSQMNVGARLDFLRKTYSLFLGGILFAIIMGTITLNVEPMWIAANVLRSQPILYVLLFIGLAFGAQAVSRVEGLNYAALAIFTGFIGFAITPLLFYYESRFPGLVTQAAVLATLTFGSLTAYVFITKTDFSFLRGILFVALVALIIGGLLNYFIFGSSMASYLMAWFTLVLFSGFVLYDTSKIMTTHDGTSYVSAALHLFIDFLNIFLALLRILSGSRN